MAELARAKINWPSRVLGKDAIVEEILAATFF
jgi:hypothetical protein